MSAPWTQPVSWNNNNTGFVNPVTGALYAATPAYPSSRVITVGPQNGPSAIQAAIDSVTDALPINYSAGTVSVTNGSAQITFSSAPAADMVVAGRDLFSIDGVRFYQIKNGPTTAGGTIFNLLETYQGATNATAAFGVYKPNPVTVLLTSGVYDFTSVALARNILTKPYVGVAGVDRDSCVIRRNKNDPTPTTTPLIGLAHGSWLGNLTIDSVDGHFDIYRMGLAAQATTQTQAMMGSRWYLHNVALLNKDPNGIDTGADYNSIISYFNGDELLMDRCYFEHCWDGFNCNTQGGRLQVTLIDPTIYKLPTPISLQASGACFIRAGCTSGSTTDVVIVNPVYNQDRYCAGEVFNDGAGGFIANAGGVSGMLGIGGGATGKVINPTITCDYGLNYGHCGGVVALGNAAASQLDVVGGMIRVKGAGAAGSHVGGIVCNTNGTTNISHCDIEADNAGVYNANASSTVNIRAGTRVKGTNAINCSAGTVVASANADLIGANTGAGTITLNTAS